MDDAAALGHADESITLLGRAIDYFTDRSAAIRRYASLINDDPPGEAVVFFHGDGGNGKSLLLRFLRERCSKRLAPEDWTHVKRMRNEDKFVLNLTEAQDARTVPTAATDFELGTEDILGRLRELRTDLARSGFRFPHFDYACIDYWHANGLKSDVEIKALYPAEELDFVVSALGIVGTIAPYAQLLTGLASVFNRHFGEGATRHRYRRGLDEALFRDMQRWDRKKELIDHLPVYFAADLNTQLRDRREDERVVLFFDGHERFWGSVRNVVPAENPERDQWLRTLLNRLDLRSGIVAIVAGREVPPWQTGTDAVHFDLELHHVEEFTDADAEDYLRGIEEIDPSLYGALLDLARVGDEPDRVHPLYLGLAADVVIAAGRRGVQPAAGDLAASLARSDRPRELVRRLWHYVDQESRDAIRALSACRFFDWSIYRRLDQALGLGASQARFRVLTAFSFVRPVPGAAKPVYRVHALMRQLLRDETLPILRSAHEELEGYYREQRGPAAVAEAIYHANRHDWRRGVEEWVDRFKEAMWQSRYDECRALVDVGHELECGDALWAGRVAAAIGEFATVLSRYGEAEVAFGDAIAAHKTAIRHDASVTALKSLAATQRLFGNLLTRRARPAEGDAVYRESIAVCDRALGLALDDPEIHQGKGIALRSLGDLLSVQSRHAEADAAYQQALAAFDRTLALAPDDTVAHNNQGNVLRMLGDLLARQARLGEADAAYRQALTAYDRALDLAPDYLHAHTNKGFALRTLGDLLARQAQDAEAEVVYRRALAAFDHALGLAPDDIYAHNYKGLALQALGEVLAGQARHAEAETAHRDALTAYDRALDLAPDDIYAHNYKGLAFQALGEVLARRTQDAEAEVAYRRALAAFDRVLDLAPNYPHSHNNKGLALRALGELLTGQARHAEAEVAFRQGLASLDHALNLAPDYIKAYNNRGKGLRALGEVLARQARRAEAAMAYRDGLAAHDRALALAPDNVGALSNRGETLASLGALLLDGERDDACRCFALARESLERADHIAPNHTEIRDRLERVVRQLAEAGCDAAEARAP